jgi:hypothetical protein
LPEFKLSAGAGGLVSLGLNGAEFGMSNDAGSYNLQMWNPAFIGGGYLFFDATYAEVYLGFSGGSGNITTRFSGAVSVTDTTMFSVTEMHMGLQLKFPFGNADKFLIFPVLGIEYLSTLSAEPEKGKFPDNINLSDFSSLTFNIGVGMDFVINPKLYIRWEPLLAVRLVSEFEKKMSDSLPNLTTETDGVIHIPWKLALGYRF